MPFGTNCYLVASDETRDGMVIDPAGDAARILDNISELGLSIGIIVLTHAHPDHIGAIAQLKETIKEIFVFGYFFSLPEACGLQRCVTSTGLDFLGEFEYTIGGFELFGRFVW